MMSGLIGPTRAAIERRRAVPVLRYLETIIHPRWPTPLSRQPSALILDARWYPIPLSNIVPALVIALISLAYLEEEGLVLAIALLAAAVVLLVAWAAIWRRGMDQPRLVAHHAVPQTSHLIAPACRLHRLRPARHADGARRPRRHPAPRPRL